MSKAIRTMYKKRGVKPPDGKGIHTKKFHSCVSKCAQRQGGKTKGKVNCYAVCMANLGVRKAVKKGHRRGK